MKAAVYTRYGPPEVLEIRDVEKPVPRDDQILVRVHATTVTSGDVRVRGADPWLVRLFAGVLHPKRKIIGSEIAGVVEAVGRDAKQFKVGDRIFGSSVSGYAEYAAVKDGGPRTLLPANATFEEAAALPFGAGCSLYFLRRGGIRKGQRVLIYGASGGLGTAGVQLAKHFGAEVTAVCSTANVELVKSLGADRVIDYTREDFAEPGAYDVVYHTVGKIHLGKALRSLKKGGTFVTALGLFLVLARTRAALGGKKYVGGVAKVKAEDLDVLRGLVEAGELRVIIDRRYPLEQIAEAHRYVDTGRKRGNVVITVASR